MVTEENLKKHEIILAKRALTILEAIKVLLNNNDLACEIHIANLKIGISENSRMIPIVDFEIEEINKFLAGEESSY